MNMKFIFRWEIHWDAFEKYNLKEIYNALFHYVFLTHHTLTFCPGGSGSGAQGTAQGGPGTGGVSGNLTTQAAFEYRGTWIPLMTVSVQGSAKAT